MSYTTFLFILEFVFLLFIWGYLFLSGSFNNKKEKALFSLVVLSVFILGIWISLFKIIEISVSFLILIFYLGLIKSLKQQLQSIVRGLTLYNILMFGAFLGLAFGILSLLFPLSNNNRFNISIFTAVQVLQTSLTEELLFRGIIFGYLRKSKANFIVVNIIQTFLFVLGHANPFNWEKVLLVLAFGWCAGWLVNKTNSIAAATTMHLIANLVGAL